MKYGIVIYKERKYGRNISNFCKKFLSHRKMGKFPVQGLCIIIAMVINM